MSVSIHILHCVQNQKFWCNYQKVVFISSVGEWVAGFSLTSQYFKTISNQHYRINGIKAVAVSLHIGMELMSTNHLNLKTDTDTVSCSVLKCVCEGMSVWVSDGKGGCLGLFLFSEDSVFISRISFFMVNHDIRALFQSNNATCATTDTNLLWFIQLRRMLHLGTFWFAWAILY